MSLEQRACAAGLAEPVVVCDVATLSRLKADVRRYVSIEEIAQLLSRQPQRARSELLGACRQAYQLQAWAAVPEKRRSALAGQLVDEVLGFGPIEPLLGDAGVSEIMVNGPKSVFVERAGNLERADVSFTDQAQLRALIDRVLGPLGRRVDESSPMVNARLPQGHRVNVVMPPLAPDGPIVTIRKFTNKVITLADMEVSGSVDESLRRFLEWAVLARKNIVVSGGTGSGKTTLLNALSCCIRPGERIVTIEDTAELRFLEHPHVVRLEARPRNAEGAGEVTIRDLVVNALRMRPDRIVVGECRGAEAVDMLTAMNTGHDGSLTTLHANSPADVLPRITTMVRYGVDLPVDVIEANAASAFNVVVQTSRALDGRRYVSHVAEFLAHDDGRRCGIRAIFARDGPDARGVWHELPDWVGTLEAAAGIEGKEVRQWMESLRYAA